MFFGDQQTYYDLLEVSPQASISEIKTAYMRMKNAYGKDSAATYSLVSQEDLDFLIKRLDEAFDILTSPEKRKKYDSDCGIIPKIDEPNKIVSIDRVPPMESSNSSDDLLIAPSTHFETPNITPVHTREETRTTPTNNIFTQTENPTIKEEAFKTTFLPTPPVYEKKVSTFVDIANFQLELEKENEWSGVFLKRIREMLGISIDELATFSRVNKSYLVAIEEDTYKKLPAPVFLRGFLMQICKKLKLPHEKVIAAYLDRYKNACPEKF